MKNRWLENQTVSEGTLRPKDIGESTYYFLCLAARRIQFTPEQRETIAQLGNLLEADPEDHLTMFLEDDVYFLMNDLAPDEFYYGTHPGDGALFGFWEYDDENKWRKEDLGGKT